MKKIINKDDQYIAKIFCNALRDKRREKNLTQLDLARLIGHDWNTEVNLWENGHRLPGLLNLVKVCRALDTTPNDLLGF